MSLLTELKPLDWLRRLIEFLLVWNEEHKFMSNPLVEVMKLGQSIWYDNIRRGNAGQR